MGINFTENNGNLSIALEGDFIRYSEEADADYFLSALSNPQTESAEISGNSLGKWDSSLVNIVYKAQKIAKERNIALNISKLPDGLKGLLELVENPTPNTEKDSGGASDYLSQIGTRVVDRYRSFVRGLTFTEHVLRSIGRFFSRQANMRRVDFLFALEDCSYKALPIVMLISFMVGLIFAFVGAMQLKTFGAEIYVASLVAIAVVRIMGAVMTGIIMSGRTGAAYAATIGTMQVNEELDAMKTMGIPTMDFVVLPRILALMITMPLLTVFSDIFGMLGGYAVGIFMLKIPAQTYWKTSFEILNARHFLVGIFHGFVFGIVIALCGCYYGIQSGKDADSVGKATTKAVVASIVWIIISTAIITFIFEVLDI